MPSRFEFIPETLQWCRDMLVKHQASFVQESGGVEGRDCETLVPTYNLMADGLEWADEQPVGLLNNGELKQLYSAMLNARTSVILGDDENGLASRVLQAGDEIIPAWPVLSPPRRAKTWAETFLRLQSESSAVIDRILNKTTP